MKKPNAFLTKVAEQQRQTNRALIAHAIDRDWKVWTIVLNRSLGLGRKRLKQLEIEAKAVYDEYIGDLDCDTEYADEKLDRAVKQIMKEI